MLPIASLTTQGINRYAYVNNDPVNSTDFSGLLLAPIAFGVGYYVGALEGAMDAMFGSPPGTPAALGAGGFFPGAAAFFDLISAIFGSLAAGCIARMIQGMAAGDPWSIFAAIVEASLLFGSLLGRTAALRGGVLTAWFTAGRFAGYWNAYRQLR